jgi:L-threonylcarbamoyladenylate synthase
MIKHMITRIFPTDHLDDAAVVLKKGGLVAFPTETVYGLGANALDDKACRAIYEAKGRPDDNPFIIHLPDVASVASVAVLNSDAELLLGRFAPGPLTVILPKKPGIVCATATAHLNSVAVRVPAHDIARRFLKECGVPVAAPSANLSGQLSATTAAMVLEMLGGRIDGVIDGGNVSLGLESTVVSLLDQRIVLMRAGFVSLEMLQTLFPDRRIEVQEKIKESEQALSPGQKYRHYQPSRPLYLISADKWSWERLIKEHGHERIGILSLLPPPQKLPVKWSVASFHDSEEYAHNLYETLNNLSQNNCSKLIAVLPSSEGIARALADRLCRAADNKMLW